MDKITLMGVMVGAISSVVWAEGADSALLQCANISDNTLRLACFDKVVGAQLPTLTPAAAMVEAPKGVDLKQTIAAKKEGSPSPLVFVSTQDQQRLDSIGLDGHITEAYTPLSLAWDLDKNDESGILSVREHHALSLMPAWYNFDRNIVPRSPSRAAAKASTEGDKNLEARMQVSFKSKLAEDLFRTRADLWFGYTQVSHWQVYNQSNSAPFRNTDYEPELILTQPVKLSLPLGGQLRMAGVGVVHQSNGRSEPLSRSWNRVYAMAGMEWGKLTVIPRWWVRLDSKNDDDNPDIEQFMGYGDIQASYQLRKNQSLAGLFRFNPATGKGAVQVDYTFPIKNRLKGYVRYFEGYGMNLLDYNHYNRSMGVGVKLTDWHSL